MNKYMEQQEQTLTWKHAKKTKKTKKGKKKSAQVDSSSEEDIPVVHEVFRLSICDASYILIEAFVCFR